MRRDLKTLSSLKRLSRLRLDEKRRECATLHQNMEDIRQDAQALEDSLIHEEKIALDDAEVAVAYGNYVQSAVAKRQTLAQNAVEAENRLAVKTAEMADHFSHVKRYEIIEDNRQRAYRAEEEKQQQAQIDEQAATRHHRTLKPPSKAK